MPSTPSVSFVHSGLYHPLTYLTYLLGQQYGSSDDEEPVAKSSARRRHAAADDEYESDQPTKIRTVDARHDPFEDPETDGVEPGGFDDNADLEGIEDEPARAREIVDEMVCTCSHVGTTWFTDLCADG